jgi:hypothetical protein
MKPEPLTPRRVLLAVCASIIVTALVIWLNGCANLADYRRCAFRDMQASLLGLPPVTEAIYIRLPEMIIHIVPDVSKVATGKCAQNGCVGCADRNNTIWVNGYEVNGKIIINQAVLGHELHHLLNFANPMVADPDRLD